MSGRYTQLPVRDWSAVDCPIRYFGADLTSRRICLPMKLLPNSDGLISGDIQKSLPCGSILEGPSGRRRYRHPWARPFGRVPSLVVSAAVEGRWTVEPGKLLSLAVIWRSDTGNVPQE